MKEKLVTGFFVFPAGFTDEIKNTDEISGSKRAWKCFASRLLHIRIQKEQIAIPLLLIIQKEQWELSFVHAKMIRLPFPHCFPFP